MTPSSGGNPSTKRSADLGILLRGNDEAVARAFSHDVSTPVRAGLYAAADAKELEWFYDAGMGVQKVKAAPTQELDAALKAYLRHMQTRAKIFCPPPAPSGRSS